MAGKGSKWRQNFNYKKYFENIDQIKSNPNKQYSKKEIKLKNGHTKIIY